MRQEVVVVHFDLRIKLIYPCMISGYVGFECRELRIVLIDHRVLVIDGGLD